MKTPLPHMVLPAKYKDAPRWRDGLRELVQVLCVMRRDRDEQRSEIAEHLEPFTSTNVLVTERYDPESGRVCFLVPIEAVLVGYIDPGARCDVLVGHIDPGALCDAKYQNASSARFVWRARPADLAAELRAADAAGCMVLGAWGGFTDGDGPLPPKVEALEIALFKDGPHVVCRAPHISWCADTPDHEHFAPYAICWHPKRPEPPKEDDVGPPKEAVDPDPIERERRALRAVRDTARAYLRGQTFRGGQPNPRAALEDALDACEGRDA